MHGRANPLMDRKVVGASGYPSVYLPAFLSLYLSVCLSVCLSIYLPIYLSIYLSIDLSMYLAIYLPIYLRIYLSICLSISLSVYTFYWFICTWSEAFLRDFPSFWASQHPKWSKFARLPQHLTTSRKKQFCETSLKNEKLSAELTASCHCALRFSHSICLKYCARQETWGQVIRSAAPVMQSHLSKPEHMMLQSATRLPKSSPWPPNISDKHVSCVAPATQNASFQIILKFPTLAICFGHATNHHVLLTFRKVPTPLRPPCETTSESSNMAPACVVLNILIWTCTFSTSQLPKVVWHWGVLYILTLTCASRHSSAHFFLTLTSKSGPMLVCFVQFYFCMCFAPQPREPTFRPSGATNHSKNKVFRDSAPGSSFFWLPLLWSLWSLTLPTSAFSLSTLSEVWLL